MKPPFERKLNCKLTNKQKMWCKNYTKWSNKNIKMWWEKVKDHQVTKSGGIVCK